MSPKGFGKTSIVSTQQNIHGFYFVAKYQRKLSTKKQILSSFRGTPRKEVKGRVTLKTKSAFPVT